MINNDILKVRNTVKITTIIIQIFTHIIPEFNQFLNTGKRSFLFTIKYKIFQIVKREKERDLTQSYDKSPYTNRRTNCRSVY